MNTYLGFHGHSPVGFQGGSTLQYGDPYGLQVIPYALKGKEGKCAHAKGQLAKWRAKKPGLFTSQRKIDQQIAKWKARVALDCREAEAKVATFEAKQAAKQKKWQSKGASWIAQGKDAVAAGTEMVTDMLGPLGPGTTTAAPVPVTDLYNLPAEPEPTGMGSTLAWLFGGGAVLAVIVAAVLMMRKRRRKR